MSFHHCLPFKTFIMSNLKIPKKFKLNRNVIAVNRYIPKMRLSGKHAVINASVITFKASGKFRRTDAQQPVTSVVFTALFCVMERKSCSS